MLMDFTDYISQRSVATQFSRGGMFINHFIAIFHRMCQWKNCGNRSIFGKDNGE